jgi:hypothetical protein
MKILITILILTSINAEARLGETLDQAEARYGLPKLERVPDDFPALLPYSRERTFRYDGWIIRAAFLEATDGREYIVREEYWKERHGPFIKDFEVQAILQAESNGRNWSPEEASLHSNNTSGPMLPSTIDLTYPLIGRTWVRADGATATLGVKGAPMVLELPHARKWETELMGIQEAQARAAVPKF